jgi:hypothetical protein
MSTLIENLILKMLREDVSEVDGTTELSVTAGNTPTSKSGYDVKLLGTKSYGKGKRRTQNAQKIAKQRGAYSAFVITFVKPSKDASVNDNFILDDIKTICSMGRTVGSGANARYNDGKHTFIIIPVKSTNRKKVFHIWIYDTSVYENAIEEIQNKLKSDTPVTGASRSRAATITKLDKIPIISKNIKSLTKSLIENDIECRPLICGSINEHPFWYERYGKQELPNSKMVHEFGIYLPNNHQMTDDEITKVIKIVNNNI